MKKLLALMIAFCTLFALTPAMAAPSWTPYSPQSLAAAQKSGKTVVIDVHADWCPTCRAQQPTLNELRADKRLKDAIFMKVNFDTDKAFLRQNRIPRQSTIVVFKGRKEVARSIAETNRTKLRAIVLNAL